MNNVNNSKNWYNKINPNFKPAFTVFMIGLVLFIFAVMLNLLKHIITGGGLSCPTFGGNLPCSGLGFLIMSLIYFFWYIIIIIFPLSLLTFIATLLIRKFKKQNGT